MGWGFDIFQKFAVKFPAHGQTIPVKCTNISRPGRHIARTLIVRIGKQIDFVSLYPRLLQYRNI